MPTDWDDGFGDQLNIAEKIRLAEIMAHERGVPSSIHDDVVQEATITAWQVSQKDSRPEYVHGAMRNRTVSVARDESWTGKEGHRGFRDAQKDVVALGTNKDGEQLTIEDVGRAAEIPDSVLIAYHRGEILKALETLSPRERLWVLGRFWGEMTHRELQAQHLAPQYWYRAKEKLAPQLAHLRELVNG